MIYFTDVNVNDLDLYFYTIFERHQKGEFPHLRAVSSPF